MDKWSKIKHIEICQNVVLLSNKMEIKHNIIFGNKLKNVNYVKYLDVIIRQKLMVSSHIEQIYSKTLRSLGFLIQTSSLMKTFLKHCMFQLSKTKRPLLKYCSVLLNPMKIGLTESLERVQRRFF